MSATYVNDGKRGNYANTGSAIVAGDVISLVTGTSGRIGIAITAIPASTGTGEYERTGRFTMVKATGEAMTLEQVVYFDGTSITGTSTTTYTRAGRVAAAAASAATTVDVWINAF